MVTSATLEGAHLLMMMPAMAAFSEGASSAWNVPWCVAMKGEDGHSETTSRSSPASQFSRNCNRKYWSVDLFDYVVSWAVKKESIRCQSIVRCIQLSSTISSFNCLRWLKVLDQLVGSSFRASVLARSSW